MNKNDGGTAFPMQDPQAIHAYAIAKVGEPSEENVHTHEKDYLAARAEAVSGLSIRDYFAAKAMQAMLTRECPISTANMATDAYIYADSMIAARVKP